MADITISSGEFKALSSDARVKILKLLKERRHTLSEISAKMGIAAPSAKQHLQMLQDKGFIERVDEGRKWKYYALTGKGIGIADAEQNQTHILIVLGATLVALVGIMAIMFSNMGMQGIPAAQGPALTDAGGTEPAFAVPAAAEKGAGNREAEETSEVVQGGGKGETVPDAGGSATEGGIATGIAEGTGTIGGRLFTEDDCSAIESAASAIDRNFTLQDINALIKYCKKLVPD
ncbi:MAG: winged helix-turn-helix domain-containing protein [Candidatus Diapherotrites archaeon]